VTLNRTGFALAGALLALGIAGASGADSNRPASRPESNAEVLTGMYQCSGSVFSDGQGPRIQAIVYLSGTSDLVSDFAPLPSEAVDVPAELDAMDRICASNLESARASAPPNCTLTAISVTRGVFGNGSSSGSSFSFVCEGRRDAVIRAVAAFSRSVVLGNLQ
jgi:hypothetical protein